MSEDSGLDLEKAAGLFAESQDFTVGLEEEFAIVDPDSLELVHEFEAMKAVCDKDELLAVAAAGELIDTEIEIRSGKGEDFADAASMQREHRERLFTVADEMGLGLAAWGTHPWANYLDQQIIDTEHYNRLRGELQWVALRNNTWSNHVHVGIRGADRAIAVCDHLREVLPPLLALSANSPFLDGHGTGLHSTRTQIFTRMFPAAASTSRSGPGASTRPSSRSSRPPRRSWRRHNSGGASGPTTGSGRSSCGFATRRPAARSRLRWRA